MNALLAILKVTDARVTSYWQADCTTDFLGDTSPSPPPLGWVIFFNFLMLMKMKLFEIFFMTLQEHFLIKVQSKNQTIAERCSFFEVQMCMKYMYFFMFYQRGDVAPKEDPVSTLQYLLGPLPKLAVWSIC